MTEAPLFKRKMLKRIYGNRVEKILEENHRRTLIAIGVIGFSATVLYFAFLYHLWHIQLDYTRTKNYVIEHLRPEYGQFAIEEVR